MKSNIASHLFILRSFMLYNVVVRRFVFYACLAISSYSYTMNSPTAQQPWAPNTTINNTVMVTVSPEIITQITLQLQELRNKAYDAATAPLHLLSDFYTWLSENKIKTTMGVAAFFYLYLHYKLLSIKYLLNNNENWSLWNRTTTLEDFFMLPQKNVAESLTRELQRRYTTTENPDDVVTPMVTFLQEVEREQKLLQSYVSLCSWIKTLWLQKICWRDEELWAACDNRLKRLAYLRSVFVQWITEQKLAHYQAASAA